MENTARRFAALAKKLREYAGRAVVQLTLEYVRCLPWP